MAGLIEKLKGLRSVVSDSRGSLKAMQDRIEALRREREDLLSAGLSKDDVLVLLDRWMEESTAGFVLRLQGQLDVLRRRGMEAQDRLSIFHGPLMVPERGAGATSFRGMQEALLCLLGEPLRAGLREAVQSMEWPESGPPLAVREARLVAIAAELEGLEREEAEILGELRSLAYEGR